MDTKWENVGSNSVRSFDGFYLSYNPGFPLIPIFSSDDGGDETAIVKGSTFLILNGDWRDAYDEVAAGGFEACLALFNEHAPDHGSSWSNSPEELTAS